MICGVLALVRPLVVPFSLLSASVLLFSLFDQRMEKLQVGRVKGERDHQELTGTEESLAFLHFYSNST